MTTWPDGKLTKTLREVAVLLNVHRNTILRWVKSGEMSCTRFGRNSIQFTFDQVVAFIDKSEFEVTVNYPITMKGGD
jgi:excisionase family DNA binding protein